MDMRIGAEAQLVQTDGGIRKERVAKGYRHPQLDQALRTGRTKMEARLLAKAGRAGVPVPSVERLDETMLLLEYIDGVPLEQVLDDRPDLAKQLGEMVADLHDAGIIHGDLTTSNMILADRIFLVDFGLAFHSRKHEDRAVDLHVLRQALESRHHRVADEAFARFVEGYRAFRDADAVMDRLDVVEKRGRNK